ncbi:hypothetical protein [Spirosoma endophyticum]|uniref:NADH-quinone oxidoreductase subunit E n=1 Tax=Spirosoma endophyticum TaxID=662367 RepID=A0A1I1G3T0_9BACT|nr:hypothetical protein [Spirosoma endophyticum]SFC03850.1 hypothetical protein SAMN05216167_101329 [Spirosoma endophyticum]
MFGLDPLSRPVAIAEILLLLAFVAFIGWLLGRLMLAGRISTLRVAIDDKKAELDKCRSEKVSGMAAVKTTEPATFKPVYPYEAEDVEPPHLFVSADPLLPAYSHEDTPAPIVNDELAAEIMDASATETPAPVTYRQEESEPESSIEAPQLFVSADPLLPIYSHDDTPELLVDDTLAAEINEASATVVAEKPMPTLPDEAFEPVEVTEPLPVETPQLFVSADPLLPIYSYDDTPSPLVNDDLAGEINDASPPVIGEKLSLVGSAFEFPTEEESNVMESPPAVEDRETIVLNRIKSRISEVNFDRIGRATAAQADDLKDIIGVGPFLERKLHALGIYTFRQVANFSKEDINTINELIEFFPGRIEGDNWVGQSKTFYERKYGAKS